MPFIREGLGEDQVYEHSLAQMRLLPLCQQPVANLLRVKRRLGEHCVRRTFPAALQVDGGHAVLFRGDVKLVVPFKGNPIAQVMLQAGQGRIDGVDARTLRQLRPDLH